MNSSRPIPQLRRSRRPQNTNPYPIESCPVQPAPMEAAQRSHGPLEPQHDRSPVIPPKHPIYPILDRASKLGSPMLPTCSPLPLGRVVSSISSIDPIAASCRFREGPSPYHGTKRPESGPNPIFTSRPKLQKSLFPPGRTFAPFPVKDGTLSPGRPTASPADQPPEQGDTKLAGPQHGAWSGAITRPAAPVPEIPRPATLIQQVTSRRTFPSSAGGLYSPGSSGLGLPVSRVRPS